MAEFYFTAAIANGYEYRNTPDNYRHFLMELPVNKEELTYIFKEIGLELDAKPGEYIFEITDFYLPGVNAKRLFSEIEIEDSMGLAVRIDEYLRANHPDYESISSVPSVFSGLQIY